MRLSFPSASLRSLARHSVVSRLAAAACFTMPALASADGIIGEPEAIFDRAITTGRNPVIPTATLTPTQQNEFLTRINNARINGRKCGSKSYGATKPVTWNLDLAEAAQRHSDDMAVHNFFDHYGSDGSSPWDRIRQAGYPLTSGGENIAAGFTSIRPVVAVWLKSPGHCANIMSPRFREMGAARADNAYSAYRIYWTLDLARR